MLYKVGMFGGSFDPVHMGHVSVIFQGAASCEEFHLVLSYSRKRDHIPMEHRRRWLLKLTEHLPNVRIHLLEDTAATKEDYDRDTYWQAGAEQVRRMIGKPIDLIYCGSDYEGTGRYEGLYPESQVLYIPRSRMPISSTKIREDPFGYWEWLPAVARPYFVKKVLLIGGESTGKTTLAQSLATLYNTQWVEEAGRQVCLDAGGEEFMLAEDLHKCLVYQKAAELKAVEKAHRLLFVDTDALITKFYIQFLLEDGEQRRKAEAAADALAGLHDFDLVLFLEPTVPFVQDGTRNEAILRDREMLSEQIKTLFRQAGIPFRCLSGDYGERLEQAKQCIYDRYGICL